MKRVIGFGLLCFGAGMLVKMFVTQFIVVILMVGICIFLGYNLFCC